jgi:hypothetical protein
MPLEFSAQNYRASAELLLSKVETLKKDRRLKERRRLLCKAGLRRLVDIPETLT